MERKVVLYDACVLYPFYLRDLLVRLAMTDLVQGKWTDEIHDEWIRNLSKNEGIPIEQLTRTRRLMDRAVLDCLVTDYAERIPNLQLPDPDDRHVLEVNLRAFRLERDAALREVAVLPLVHLHAVDDRLGEKVVF